MANEFDMGNILTKMDATQFNALVAAIRSGGGGGGGGGVTITSLTQAEYDALVDKTGVYFITDADDIAEAGQIAYDNTDVSSELDKLNASLGGRLKTTNIRITSGLTSIEVDMPTYEAVLSIMCSNAGSAIADMNGFQKVSDTKLFISFMQATYGNPLLTILYV